jgi:hypothetical protein
MKHLLLAALVAVSLCVLAPAGLAQTTIGDIGLYADANHEGYCVSGTGFYPVEMYVWAKPTTPKGLQAFEFAIQYPANVAPGAITWNDNVSIFVGNPRDGISIAYYENACQSDWTAPFHQTVYVMNQDPSWAVLTHDQYYTKIIACDCTPGYQISPLRKTANLCFNFCTSNFDTPFIMSVAKIDAQNLNVVFSEKVTPESAGAIANYTLYDKSTGSGTVPILSAAYQPDSFSVHLALGAPILAGRPYLLEARDIVTLHGTAGTSSKGFGDLPNLAFTTQISATPLKNPCGSLDVTFQIQNTGVGQAGPFDIDVDWTADIHGFTHDAALGHYDIAGLAPGATLSLHYTYAWPDTSTIANAALVTLDPLGRMPESNETDNYDDSNWPEDYSANHLKVTDVPGDQGKLVHFEFETVVYSFEDVMYDPFIQYDIYRSDPAGWTLLTTIPENGSHRYHVDLATLADSTKDQGTRWSVFKVRTKARRVLLGGPIQYFESCPDSGYSVDNLPPAAPQGLAASMFDGGLTLRWNANPEPDVAKYVLYRSVFSNFTPAPENRVATIAGALEYFDDDWYPGSYYSYKLVAKDLAGNEGPWASTIPDQYVATLLKSYTASLKEAAIELAWTLSVFDGNGRFAVYRADGAGADFREIPSAGISRAGLDFTFVDESVAGGESYRYRVAFVTAGASQVLFETETIEAPELPLTLYQNFPNPFNPLTTIRYYLPAAGRVRLDIFDASGKLVVTLADKQMGKGAHAAEWKGTNANGSQVRSGVYFYRLVTRSQTLTHKMVLLR